MLLVRCLACGQPASASTHLCSPCNEIDGVRREYSYFWDWWAVAAVSLLFITSVISVLMYLQGFAFW